jgi:chromosome segregation ATPase
MNRYIQDDLQYERDRNVKVKSKITDEEHQRNDYLNQLRNIDNRNEDHATTNDQLHQEMGQKTNYIKDLEKDYYFHQEKIKQLNNQIEQLKYENS